MKIKILVIEDDPLLGEVLVENIKCWKFLPSLAHQGKLGLREALSNDYDLIIADIALPDVNGLRITKEMRSSGLNTPIIVITEQATTVNNEASYESGANIFHPKPINFKLLFTQVRSLLKLYGSQRTVQLGKFFLDANQMKLFYEDHCIDLTPKELRLLQALSANPGYVLDRDKLMNATFRGSNDYGYGSIDTLISRLRKRISSLSPDFDLETLIETVHGMGYRLSISEKSE